MPGRFRRHLSFANVASALALCVAVGGGTTAVALSGKGSVDSGDIRNGQVRTRDLARDAATGKKVRESSLSIVPDAAHAEDSDRLGGVPGADYQFGNGGTGAFGGSINVGTVGTMDLGSAELRISCADPSVTLNVRDHPGGPVPQPPNPQNTTFPTDVWIGGDHDAITSDGGSSAGVTVAAAESSTLVQVWTVDNVVTDARFDVVLNTVPATDTCEVVIPFSQNLALAGVATSAANRAAGRLPTVTTHGIQPR